MSVVLDVKLDTCAVGWPWSRQTPGGHLQWGGMRFAVDHARQQSDAWVVFEELANEQTVLCPADRTVFICGEPDSIGVYPEEFLAQFHWVISGRDDLRHPRQIRLQQGHPWFVEKSFDELAAMTSVPKTRSVCVVSSDKAFTEGHRERLRFVDALREGLGGAIDVWGRGIRDFERKWDLLADYRYAVVLENFAGPDFLTEKLADALFAFCVPLYHGCTNLGRYFDATSSVIPVDLQDAKGTVDLLRRLIADPTDYERRLPGLIDAREWYLRHGQFFANLAAALQVVVGLSRREAEPITLRPRRAFSAARSEVEPMGAASSVGQETVLRAGGSGWRRFWKGLRGGGANGPGAGDGEQ